MTLFCNGRAYDTDEMRAFRTLDAAVPRVYLTRDCRAVFVLTCQKAGAVHAHRAGTAEIISLALRHGIPDLLGAFPAHSATAAVSDWDNFHDESESRLTDRHPRPAAFAPLTQTGARG